jgi:hypothetical protein
MLRRRLEIAKYRIADISLSIFSPPFLFPSFLPANFFNPFLDKENARARRETEALTRVRVRAFHFYYRGAR